MCVAGPAMLVAGRYQLQTRIPASDGREEAWRADDLARGRRVAVRLPKAGRPVRTDDFLATARDAARIRHSGIERVLDYGRTGTDGTPFLVTELTGTASIAVVLRAGRLDPPWVLDVICQVSLVLEALHAHGLIHQDIQPGNLLLAPGGMVKVSGSWMSGVIDPSWDSAAYRAPELAEGAPAMPAADLYSLGAVAWECLTGTLPAWPGSGFPDTVPDEVADLVAELVASDPAGRPASARQLAARARGLLDRPMRTLAGEAGVGGGLLLRDPLPDLPKTA